MPEQHMMPVLQKQPGQPSFRAGLQTQLQTTQRLLAQSRAKRRERGLRLNSCIKARWPVVLLGSATALGIWFGIWVAAPAFAARQEVTADNNGNNDPGARQNSPTLPHHRLEASLRWLFAMLLTGRSLMQATRFLLAFFTTKKSA
jgi:hypothetical protein